MSEEVPNIRRPSRRLTTVDALRGFAMVLMVLDHVRDFFGDVRANPTDPATTNALLFLTRWITHFCAPVFVLLAGVGAGLGAAGERRRTVAAGLLRRGAFLILLEVTVIRFGLTFDPTFAFIPLTVVWVIGLSMIVLSGLVFLPTVWIAVFGLVLIFGHNAFDGWNPGDPAAPLGLLWTVLHRRGMLGTILGRQVFLLYPLVPWVGVTALGYALASVFLMEPGRRARLTLGVGFGLIAGFVLLRASRLYGDPLPYRTFDDPVRTVFSFLNVEKYPPSLLYLAATLGPALVFLGWADGRQPGPAGRALARLGREPLFYYVSQWYLIHILAVLAAAASGRPYRWMIGGGPFSAPPGYSYGMGVVYAVWVLCVGLLYAATVRYSDFKSRRPTAPRK